MTNEELATAIQNGAEDKLPELWEQIEGLARFHANRYKTALVRGGIDFNPTELFEDFFYGCGYPALVAAVKTYDGAAGCAFSTWYSFYFKQQVYQMRGWRWRSGQTVQLDAAEHSCSLDAPVSLGDDGCEISLGEMIPDQRSEAEYDSVDDALFRQQLRDALERAISAIPQEQADAVRGTYFDGFTLREMADRGGVSLSRIQQRQAQGLRSLRKPKYTQTLKQFLYTDNEIYSAAVQGNGVGAYKHSGTSRVEQLVFAMDAGKTI